MMEEIMAFAEKEEHGEADMAAVVVMSHGKEGSIYFSDGRWLETDWILQQFNNVWCPSLRGKPKLFIFESSRGEEYDCGLSATATEGQEMRDVSWEDMVIAYSTIPGYATNRSTKDGSWFVQSLCEVFRQEANTSEIREMLDNVAKRLREYQSERGTKQSFDYVIRHLYKKFFFFPSKVDQNQENKGMENVLKDLRKFIQQDPDLQLLIGDIEEAVTGNSVISSILRMISYQQYPDSRITLAEGFPFDLQFLESSRIISFMEDVIKFGAGSVRKERLFVIGHQGSGKTSLVHSVR